MSAKQQNSSRIQLATKPLLILLPLMCGTVLISRGRRTQSASSVTVQQDTGQYRSGGGSDPEEASFEYAGLENSGTEFVFNYTPSSEAKTDTERINEAKQLFKTTALYRFVIEPLGLKPENKWINDNALNGRVVITTSDISHLLHLKWDEVFELFVLQVESNIVECGFKVPCSMKFNIPENLRVSRDSEFSMSELKDHLRKIWQSLKNDWVSQVSKRCMLIIFTIDGKVYLSGKDHFTLIESNGDLSSERVNKIKNIAHIHAIRLQDDAAFPSTIWIDNAVDIDLE